MPEDDTKRTMLPEVCGMLALRHSLDGQFERGLQLMQEGVQVSAAVNGSQSLTHALVLRDMAMACMAQNQATPASEQVKLLAAKQAYHYSVEAYQVAGPLFQEPSAHTAGLLYNVALTSHGLGRSEETLERLEQLTQLIDEFPDEQRMPYLTAFFGASCCEMYAELGETELARQVGQRTIDCCRRQLDKIDDDQRDRQAYSRFIQRCQQATR